MPCLDVTGMEVLGAAGATGHHRVRLVALTELPSDDDDEGVPIFQMCTHDKTSLGKIEVRGKQSAKDGVNNSPHATPRDPVICDRPRSRGYQVTKRRKRILVHQLPLWASMG